MGLVPHKDGIQSQPTSWKSPRKSRVLRLPPSRLRVAMAVGHKNSAPRVRENVVAAQVAAVEEEREGAEQIRRSSRVFAHPEMPLCGSNESKDIVNNNNSLGKKVDGAHRQLKFLKFSKDTVNNNNSFGKKVDGVRRRFPAPPPATKTTTMSLMLPNGARVGVNVAKQVQSPAFAAVGTSAKSEKV